SIVIFCANGKRMDILWWMSKHVTLTADVFGSRRVSKMLNAFFSGKGEKSFLQTCLRNQTIRKFFLVGNSLVFWDLVRIKEHKLVKYLWKHERELFLVAKTPSGENLVWSIKNVLPPPTRSKRLIKICDDNGKKELVLPPEAYQKFLSIFSKGVAPPTTPGK